MSRETDSRTITVTEKVFDTKWKHDAQYECFLFDSFRKLLLQPCFLDWDKLGMSRVFIRYQASVLVHSLYFLIEFSLSIRSIFAVCFAFCSLCINYSAGAATYFFVITFSLCYMVFSPVIFVFFFIYKYFHKNKTVSCHPIEYGDSWRPVRTFEISMRHSIGL